MDKVASRISAIRQHICPRTSYYTSGSAASTLLVYAEEADLTGETFDQLSSAVIASKEFETIDRRTGELNSQALAGHTTLILYPPSISLAVELSKELVHKRATNLIYIITDSVDIATEKTSEFGVLSGVDTVIDSIDDIKLVTIFYSGASSRDDKTSSASKIDDIGFNSQPSVQSLRQFRFIWEKSDQDGTNNKKGKGAYGSVVEDAKARLLKRLADHALTDGITKLSRDAWDNIIKGFLAEGLDDFGIYSELRKRFMGSSLEESLRIVVEPIDDTTDTSTTAATTDTTSSAETILSEESSGSIKDSAEDAAGGVVVATGDPAAGEDGRASHMVSMTIECIPTNMVKSQSIRSMLDYGCAEGAITAQLCKQLNIPLDRAYGADVRSIPSPGFTFIQLSTEGPEPPKPREILSAIPDASIDLVTCAMVFHHVIHIEDTLAEIRRVLSPNGVLVIREHNCTSAGMGAFLDITHGLYSLSWKDPVEDPRFLDDYKAFYRGREEWTSLLEKVGFQRVVNASSRAQWHYDCATSSFLKPNGNFPNVIKAYYATYALRGSPLCNSGAAPPAALSSPLTASGSGSAGGWRGGGHTSAATTTGSGYSNNNSNNRNGGQNQGGGGGWRRGGGGSGGGGGLGEQSYSGNNHNNSQQQWKSSQWRNSSDASGYGRGGDGGGRGSGGGEGGSGGGGGGGGGTYVARGGGGYEGGTINRGGWGSHRDSNNNSTGHSSSSGGRDTVNRDDHHYNSRPSSSYGGHQQQSRGGGAGEGAGGYGQDARPRDSYSRPPVHESVQHHRGGSSAGTAATSSGSWRGRTQHTDVEMSNIDDARRDVTTSSPSKKRYVSDGGDRMKPNPTS